MKRKISYLMITFLIFLVSGCSSSRKNLDKISNRMYYGDKGGTILVSVDKNNGGKILIFSGKSVIKPTTNPSELSQKSVKKEKTKEFKNPKIIKKI